MFILKTPKLFCFFLSMIPLFLSTFVVVCTLFILFCWCFLYPVFVQVDPIFEMAQIHPFFVGYTCSSSDTEKSKIIRQFSQGLKWVLPELFSSKSHSPQNKNINDTSKQKDKKKKRRKRYIVKYLFMIKIAFQISIIYS